MNGLYPIIRRQRRPLWPPEEPNPVVGVAREPARQVVEVSRDGAEENLDAAAVGVVVSEAAVEEAAVNAVPISAPAPGRGARRAGKSSGEPKSAGAAGAAGERSA
jgi:hypothetical protein